MDGETHRARAHPIVDTSSHGKKVIGRAIAHVRLQTGEGGRVVCEEKGLVSPRHVQLPRFPPRVGFPLRFSEGAHPNHAFELLNDLRRNAAAFPHVMLD